MRCSRPVARRGSAGDPGAGRRGLTGQNWTRSSHDAIRAWRGGAFRRLLTACCATIPRCGCSCPSPSGCRARDQACGFAGPFGGQSPLLTMFWPAARDASTLPVIASRAADDGPDTLDLLRLPVESVIWRERAGHEYVVIGDRWRRVRLDAVGASLAGGPVHLRYDLSGFRRLRAGLVSLGRLEALKRLGRLPRALFARDPVAGRWMNALAARDMRAAGASQIDIAIALFGAGEIDADSVERIRKRVARLLLLADRRIAAGYQRFFVD